MSDYAVTIKYKDKEINLFTTNGNLKLSVLKQYFSRAAGLTYEDENGKTYGLDIVDNCFVTIPSIKEYDLFVTETSENEEPNRKRAFKEMLADLKYKKLNETEAKKQNLKCKEPYIGQKKYVRRILYIGWRHRESSDTPYLPMKSSEGYLIKLDLNANEEYPITKLKNLMLKSFMVSPSNNHFFKNSIAEVGTAENIIINSYLDSNGEECGFWEYSKRIRGKDHRLQLYILTTWINVQSTKMNKESEKQSKDNEKEFDKQNKDYGKFTKDSEKIKYSTSNYSRSTHSSASIKSSIESPVYSIPSCSMVNIKLLVDPFEIQKNKLKCLNLRIPVINEEDVQLSSTILGKGGQGTVIKGKWCNTPVAVKTMKIRNLEKLILREIKLLASIGHPNIIQILAVYPTSKHYNLVMEYFDSNCLHDILFTQDIKLEYNLNVEQKNWIGSQICTAITYLHKQLKSPIVHRDVKPANVLVDKSINVKLCDLGLGKSENLEINLLSTVVQQRGTYSYMAPEILLHKKDASINSDMWALGCTLVELYSDMDVWRVVAGAYRSEIQESIKKKLLNEELPENIKFVPDNLKLIVKRCFSYNPLERPSISALLSYYERIK